MDAPGAQGCLQVMQCAHGPVSPKWTRVTDERLARASEFPVNGILRSKDVHMSEVSWGTRLRSGTPVVPSSECFSSEVQRRSRRMKVAIERCTRSGGGSGGSGGSTGGGGGGVEGATAAAAIAAACAAAAAATAAAIVPGSIDFTFDDCTGESCSMETT